MITVDDAKSIIETHFKGTKATQAYKYADKFYLIIAPSKKGDVSDPMYLVGIADGKYRFLNPLEDLDAFNESIENGPIKTFDT